MYINLKLQIMPTLNITYTEIKLPSPKFTNKIEYCLISNDYPSTLANTIVEINITVLTILAMTAEITTKNDCMKLAIQL